MSWGRQILLLLGLARVVHVDLAHEGASLGLLEQVDHGVVDGVPVLVEPSSDVVGHSSGVVDDGKVSVLVSLALGLGEVGVLTKMLGLQLGLKGLVRGLGVDGLLLEDGEDAHGLLEELKAGSQVHTEVASHPNDALTHVLLLLQDEHGVVEELNDCDFRRLDQKVVSY